MTYNALSFLRDLFRAEVSGKPVAEPTSCTRVEDLPGDWRVRFEERAAIREYDGGLPREHAEAEALAETVREMEREAAGHTGCSCKNG